MPVNVAIVGAGPSGFYAADSLIRSDLPCRIDIIEALPTPYGLIRYGVAPDHEKTKNVWRAYEKTAKHGEVRFFGNVEVGRDIALDELRELYDAVILAIGMPLDRELAIPGVDKPGVYGSAAFVGWYNGHPGFRGLDPCLETDAAAIIGNGNVAIDVARVLVKTPEEMQATDLPDSVAERIHRSPIRDVYLIGRRGPVEAKWTNVELRELGRLENCAPVLDRAVLPAQLDGEMSDRDRRLREKNLTTLRGFTKIKPGGRSKRLHFLFLANPVEVLGGDRVEALRLERTRLEAGRAIGTGEFFDLPCGLVVSSVGYRLRGLPGLPLDETGERVSHREGRIAPGLYVVGWAKRGPTGVIGTNKPDGVQAARQIAEDLPRGAKPGRDALAALLGRRDRPWVSFEDWKGLEAAEIAAARPGAPRKKLITVKEMLDVIAQGREGRAKAEPLR